MKGAIGILKRRNVLVWIRTCNSRRLKYFEKMFVKGFLPYQNEMKIYFKKRLD